MTHWMVLMAAMPSQPASSAQRAGCVMSVTLGVILAHTGMVADWLIQPHTSLISSQSWPMAMPILQGKARERNGSIGPQYIPSPRALPHAPNHAINHPGTVAVYNAP